MEKIKFLGMASLMVLATCMTSCSSDDNNGDEEKPSQKYTWSTDGGIKACDHLLFSEVDNSEDVNGTQIGNGDAEFVFKGKQTLKKGTYISKVGYISPTEQSSPSSQVPSSRVTSRQRLRS